MRVDGGAAANNLLMQFQADLLGVPVVRPKVLETTALGAGYLAGLAVGYWKDAADVAANWRVDRVFEPAMPRDRVARAVGRLEQGRRARQGLGLTAAGASGSGRRCRRSCGPLCVPWVGLGERVHILAFACICTYFIASHRRIAGPAAMRHRPCPSSPPAPAAGCAARRAR